MGMLSIIFGEKQKPTLSQVRKDVMKFARENDLGEMEAGKMLRSQLKKYDIPYPKGMATDEEFKKQLQDPGDKPAKTQKKARGGMAKKKVQMIFSEERAFFEKAAEIFGPQYKSAHISRPEIDRSLFPGPRM